MSIKKAGRLSTAICSIVGATVLMIGTSQGVFAKDTVRVRFAEYSTKTGPFFKDLAAEFNASQDDIEVVVEHLPWPEMQQQLITDISAGTAPDISHMATRWMAGFAVDGALAPIDDLMSDNFADTFVPTFLDLQKVEGQTWGLPIAASARGMFYNKDLLEQAGAAVPTNWEETQEAAAKIAALSDEIYGIGVQGAGLDTEGYWFYSLWTHGGDIVGPDGKSGFASEAAVAATQNYIDLIKSGVTQPGVLGANREDLQNLFTAGKLGIVLSGPWLNAQLSQEAPDLKYGIAEIPMATDRATYGVTDTISILADSEVKESSMKVLEFFFNDANRLAFGKNEGFVPVLNSMANEPYFTEDPNMAVFLDMSSVAKFAPLVPQWEEMAESLKTSLAKAYAGDEDPAVALAAAADKMNALMNE
ncbi:bicyclomycin resistance protein [Sedimentitalea sp. CY04]|uniref:Bicyclomycin resistance protein n=1 Tax=Parasedimentitalea denitrificans TaxID=2211118 RepID=A0ABX0W8X6_9RHOB|nr:sugar ABC transporter substrate-binding protein [Sedimentitalea sp. CY04]NIZ62099.1 bicyclomycin resistance protein [Sedimentitalea sp. CY04]